MSPERARKLDELTQRIRQRLAEVWPEGEVEVSEVEERVQRLEHEVLRDVTEEMLREQSGKRAGNQQPCACGGVARYRKDSPLTVVTLFGRVRVMRAYYYCARCRDGHCPQDRAWHLGLGNTTPAVQALVAALGAWGSYTQLPVLLRRVRPQVVVDLKTSEWLAQRVGAVLATAPPPGYGTAERPLAVAVDGVFVPADGRHQEVRCGVVYEPDGEAGRTPQACAALRKEYFGTLGARHTLMETICARVAARRPTPTPPVAALGDGAPWIWDGYAQHLPHRVEILDFYHVAERLALIATAMFGTDAPAQTRAKAWRTAQVEALQTQGPAALLAALEAWPPPTAAAQQVRHEQLRYFRNHQERMHYPKYLEQGFPIGSGAVEGTCKHLVSDRFRGAGMRWKSHTAEPLLQLRAALLTHPDLDLRPYAGAA